MNDLIEGKKVILTNKSTNQVEEGTVKKLFNKLFVVVNRKGMNINISASVISELYEARYTY